MKKFVFISIGLLFCWISSAQVRGETCACCTENHAQFDFWVGDWETFNPEGKLAGTNSIRKVQDNCILQENWVSAHGSYTGTSYNFYNASEKKWQQLWIDNSGQSLHLSGGMEEGAMVLKSEITTNAQGENIINRITWRPNTNGTVRQLWEVQNVDTQEWNTVFDGLYKKVKK